MKKVFSLVVLMLSLSAFAQNAEEVVQGLIDGQLITSEEYENISDMNGDQKQYGQWQSSSTSCYAYTYCARGGMVQCQVYGYNYGNIPAQYSNSCSWQVIPGQAVRCQGYQSRRDYYGRVFWAWVDVPVRCY